MPKMDEAKKILRAAWLLSMEVSAVRDHAHSRTLLHLA
jgi:hypothetical protein